MLHLAFWTECTMAIAGICVVTMATAKAVAVNVTVVNATAQGYFE